MHPILLQIVYAAAFYVSVIALIRLAGKRHAGHVTTFDLLILISMVVAMQGATILDGKREKFVFVITILFMHRLQTVLTRKFPKYRALVRGSSTRLIYRGQIDRAALEEEGMTEEELRAGLRKAGVLSAAQVEEARLEETGEISAVPGAPTAEKSAGM